MSYGNGPRELVRTSVRPPVERCRQLTADATTAPALALFLAKQPYIEIYFYNTQMKQLQHTTKTDETFGIYTCNIIIVTYAISRYNTCNIRV